MGRLITLSGMDGSGKTTAARLVSAALHERGRAVRQFSLAESRMWSLLQLIQTKLGGELTEIAPQGVGLPLNLDRLAFLVDYVKPAIEQYDFVVLQRFVLDWVASGLLFGSNDIPIARAMRRLFEGPIVQVYLKVPADHAIQRIRDRGFDGDRRESAEALLNVEAFYNAALVELEGPFDIIDATLPRAQICEQILVTINRYEI